MEGDKMNTTDGSVFSIDIHADDYALSINTSKEMLELMHEGVLDSISIIPNMKCFESCMDMLKREIPSLPFLPKMSVHLNLVEGKHASTWKSLFLASYNPFRFNKYKQLLKHEISEQIERVQSQIAECIDIASSNSIPCSQKHIRIDSHQHTHMIPIVRKALFECLASNNLNCEYIRNSREPLVPFISATSLWKSYSPVNIIKNLILNFYSIKIDNYDESENHEPMYLWGLIMSGKMDPYRVEQLYSPLTSKAAKDNRKLEILFHPGRMLEDELCDEIPISSAQSFYMSSNRDIEKNGARTAKQSQSV